MDCCNRAGTQILVATMSTCSIPWIAEHKITARQLEQEQAEGLAGWECLIRKAEGSIGLSLSRGLQFGGGVLESLRIYRPYLTLR